MPRENNYEIWKPILDYEDQYLISNFGRIKSLKSNKILKEHINNERGGYYYITLCKKGKVKRFQVHRLVAQTFIDNPNDYEEINHKDKNPGNNHVENLEWCNRQYNAEYSLNKAVLQLSIDGTIIKEFPSAKIASKETGIDSSCITKVCRNKRQSAGGYIWKYVNDEYNIRCDKLAVKATQINI